MNKYLFSLMLKLNAYDLIKETHWVVCSAPNVLSSCFPTKTFTILELQTTKKMPISSSFYRFFRFWHKRILSSSNRVKIFSRAFRISLNTPTKTFTILELQNPSCDVPELQKNADLLNYKIVKVFVGCPCTYGLRMRKKYISDDIIRSILSKNQPRNIYVLKCFLET